MTCKTRTKILWSKLRSARYTEISCIFQGCWEKITLPSYSTRLSGFHSWLQEENKILDRLHRQKVAEVEKLSQTVKELEEAVLAGGAAANAVRDYQRKVQEMNVTCYHLTAAYSSILHWLFMQKNWSMLFSDHDTLGRKKSSGPWACSNKSYSKQGCCCSCKWVERW